MEPVGRVLAALPATAGAAKEVVKVSTVAAPRHSERIPRRRKLDFTGGSKDERRRRSKRSRPRSKEALLIRLHVVSA